MTVRFFRAFFGRLYAGRGLTRHAVNVRRVTAAAACGLAPGVDFRTPNQFDGGIAMAESFRRGVAGLAALALVMLVNSLGADPGNDPREPDLSAAPKLRVQAGNKVAFHAFAEG